MTRIEISGLRRSQAQQYIGELYDLMHRRRALADQHGRLPDGEERVLIVVEEASTLLNENRTAKMVFEEIARLGRKLGLSAELHVDGFMLADFGSSDLIRTGPNIRVVCDRIAP